MNTIKQPMLPDTIRFNHTIGNDQTEVMRISRDGVWVNPNVSVDDAAKAVLAALDSHIKMLVESADRERKPLPLDKDGWWRVSEDECISGDIVRKVEAAHHIGTKGGAA